MKRLITILTLLGMAATSTAFAQQPATPGAPTQPGATTPMAGPRGPHGGPAAGGTMPMMDMCQQMMAAGMMSGAQPMGGGMMGGPHAMGMMGNQQPMDPKAMAHMMEMRGEMMKAMGEVMMKHAQRMQPARP
jgi:hypothetical protein